MPAGVSWGEYLRFMAAALGTMFLGSQAVHLVYRPLDDMDQVLDQLRAVKQKQLGDDDSKTKQYGESKDGLVDVQGENGTAASNDAASTNSGKLSAEVQ